MERTCSLIRDIAKYLADEKLYQKEHIEEVFKFEPSDDFIRVVNDLLVKFKRKQSHDKFLKEFYGKTNSNWKEYFHLCNDKKIVFLMLIHLPERLIGFLDKKDDKGSSNPEVLIFIFIYHAINTNILIVMA